jgi:hypothetical protein
VTELDEALADEESRAGATGSLRGLIDRIILTPDGNSLREVNADRQAIREVSDRTSLSRGDGNVRQIRLLDTR